MKLTFLVFLMSLFGSYAQSNYFPGTITKKDGSTLNGQINYDDWPKTPSTIEFKYNDKVYIYSAKDIKSFEVLNDKYIGRNVKLDVTEQRIQKMDWHDTPQFDNVDVFLNVLNEGNANLYVYSDYRDHYFYEKNNEILELVNRESLKENNVDIKKYKKYLGQLSLIFSDCSTLVVKESLRYKLNALSDLFSTYNECGNKSEGVYTKETNKEKNALYISAGLFSSTMNIRSNEELYRNFNGKGISGPTFGLAYEHNFSKNMINKWSLYNELTYANYEKEYIYSYQRGSSSSEFRNEQTYDFQITALNLSSLIRYRFSNPNKDLTPFLNGGLGAVFAMSKKGDLVQKRLPNPDKDLFDIPIRSLFYSISLGGGLIYKKFSMEIRYTIQTNYSSEAEASLNNFGAIISYKIL